MQHKRKRCMGLRVMAAGIRRFAIVGDPMPVIAIVKTSSAIVEPFDRLPRKPISISEDDSHSIVVEVEPARLIEALHKVMQVVDPEVAYEQALVLAHEEDVSQWGAAIQAWLSRRNQAVPLLRLQRSLKMPLVQAWLALLLNGFAIQQRGEFYDLEQVWVLQSSSPSEKRSLESP